MTNQEILRIAMRQSAIDSGCLAEDFLAAKNKVVISKANNNARRYLELPFYCDLTSYGNCIVASVSDNIKYTVDFKDCYAAQWSNALCESRKNLDILAVAAYDKDKMIGLAGCSADCDTMWQIGVDVLPEYRQKGIASSLTSTLAIEILKRNKVPFYCCAWSNLKSSRNAIKSGFRPAWVLLTVKTTDFINKMNE